MTDHRLLFRVRSALSDTLCWAGRRASSPPSDGAVDSCLRSAELSPFARRVCPELLDAEGPASTPVTLADAFSGLVRARRSRLSPRAPRPSEALIEDELYRPRSLLLVDWRGSLVDGAAQAESRGFLDQNNLPPWDTWLDLISVRQPFGERTCLLAWVPAWAADQVDRGIWVVPEACLTWAEVASGTIAPRPWGEPWRGAA